MKKINFLHLFITCCCCFQIFAINPLNATSELSLIYNQILSDSFIQKKVPTTCGRLIWAEPIIAGEISLYREGYVEESLEQIGINWYTTENKIAYRYWIGKDLLTEVNSTNYRALVKKYLPEASKLHKKLGKYGFRFENLPSMVLYYNNFFGNETDVVYNMDQLKMILRE